MAFLGSIESDGAGAIALPAMTAPARAADDDFTPLEWSVIRLARVDRLSTIRPPGPLRRVWHWWSGGGNFKLANERLEALRKIAVLSWHFGFTVPGRDVTDFISAGFSADQYELLARTVWDAQRSKAAPNFTGVFA